MLLRQAAARSDLSTEAGQLQSLPLFIVGMLLMGLGFGEGQQLLLAAPVFTRRLDAPRGWGMC